MPKRITQTHTRHELTTLKVSLNKYADKVNAAITALRTAGEGAAADQRAQDLKALVGDVGDREGTTLDRLKKLIAGLENEKDPATLPSTKAEVHAYEVGLPMAERRARALENEMRSWGRDDVADWFVETANHIGSTMRDHYGEQLPLGDAGSKTPADGKPAETAQPALMP